MQRCANCDAEIPEGGSFCVECGAAAPQAATGATERLPEPATGPACPSCGTRNPPGAAFCVTCGRPFAAQPAAAPPAPSIPSMPTPEPLATPAGQALAPTARPRLEPAVWGGITGGIWLIGLAVLFMTGWWWPGILVLIGISSLLGSAGARSSGQRWGSLQGAFWMIGIAVLAVTGRWWPGILVLIGLSAIFGAVARPKSW